jgi:alpha-galactosidase
MRLIKFYLTASLLYGCAGTVTAQTIDGAWQTIQTSFDGNHSKTVFLFKSGGSHLTGKVEVAWGDLAIEQGSIQGDHLSFQVHMGSSIWKYEGQYTASGLELVVRDPNAPAAHVTAEHVANDLRSESGVPPPPLHTVSYNGLSATPPMGWNSWNHFQGHIDDATVRQVADAMVSSGMRDAGYIYVNIDDTWEGQRDSQGRIHPNKKFPYMKALADYLHARGLKLGIYSSPGTETCAGYPGSYLHEEQDARTYAEWGVDYLKYDWCSAFRLYPDTDMRAVYQKMGDALQHTGHPIIYSLCQYGKQNVWQWGRLVGGNLWRTTDDINDSYKRMAEIGFDQSKLAEAAGPGAWNDPDMLEIGNGGLNAEESRTHMTLWAMLAAPLLTGIDIRTMDARTSSILLNREVIAVDQDKLGGQAKRIWSKDDVEVWQRPMVNGEAAIAIFNRADHAQVVRLPWQSLGHAKPSTLRDLWEHHDVPAPAEEYSREVPAHGSLLFRMRSRF